MSRKTLDIEEQLRRAILGADIPPTRLARESGVAPAIMSRFLRGQRSLTLPTAAKIARLLNLELVRRSRGRQKGQ